MGQKRISQLAVADALTGSELLEIEQAASSRKVEIDTVGERILMQPPATEIVIANKTLTATSPRQIIMDPIDGAFTLTLPDPTTMDRGPLELVMQHGAGGGHGLMLNGDCEHPTLGPSIDGAPYTNNCIYARSATQVKKGSYSWEMKAANTSSCLVLFCDADNYNDQHGLSDVTTYTIGAWVFAPSTAGPAALTDFEFIFWYSTTGTSWNQVKQSAYLPGYDKWYYLEITTTLPSSCVGTRPGCRILTPSVNDKVWIDEAIFYAHHDVTIQCTNGGMIETVESTKICGPGARMLLRSDGTRYRIVQFLEQDQDYTGAGSASEGIVTWERRGRRLIMQAPYMAWSNGGTIYYPDRDQTKLAWQSVIGAGRGDKITQWWEGNTVLTLGGYDAAGTYVHGRSQQYRNYFSMLDGAAANRVGWRTEGYWY